MQEPQTYTISNIYIAGLLICKGYKVLRIDYNWQGFGVYVFEHDKGIPLTIEGYKERKFKIYPKDYIKALKKAKKLLAKKHGGIKERKTEDSKDIQE